MNIGKSIRVAMAMKGLKAKELSEKLGVTQATISVMCSRETSSGQMLKTLSDTFELKVSDFIKLGED